MTVEELEEIRDLIPNNFVIFSTKSPGAPQNLRLSPPEWALITQIDGHKTVQRIADNLGLEEKESLNLFYNLYKKELIHVKDVKDPGDVIVPPEFFKHLEATLILLIGPVASYLINDVLWDLNETKENLIKDKVPLLIESISQEISDEEKSIKFQQEMLVKLKTL